MALVGHLVTFPIAASWRRHGHPTGCREILWRASRCALVLIAATLLGQTIHAQVLTKKLLAPNGGANGDEFGQRVALVPGWAFCAAPYDDEFELQSGAVYVYRESGADWPLAQKLKASDPAFGAVLGTALAADGEWLVATTPLDDPQGYPARGSAHVYNLQGGIWVHAQKVLASDFTNPASEQFGWAASLRGDRMVIGTYLDNFKSYHSGAAYVFELSGSSWVEVAKLYASDWEFGAAFGTSVAVDGNTIVVGAPDEDNGGAIYDRGAAYVFERQGGTWVETQRLVAGDAKQSDYFGWSVAVDSGRILVGALGHKHTVTNEGAVYLFERQGGVWIQTQELLVADPQDGPYFGRDVDLAGEFAVGSGAGDDDLGTSSGSSYIFHRNSSGTWLQVAKFLAPDGQPSDIFGSDVAIAGSKVLVGALGDDDACPANIGCNSGSAYIFNFAPDAVQYGSCPTQGPCGNNDDFGGCRTSTGQGGVLSAAGSASVAANDLRFEARWLPANKLGLFFMGGMATALPFSDGQLCVTSGGMGIWRYNPPQSSGGAGVLQLGPGVAGLSQLLPPGGHIGPGQTWHFQAWFRDPAGPCGMGSNMTSAVRVTFAP